ncbi:MAG: MerR family transcriptional regulator [Helicobacter trogontum]|nr:MerR family transcriptional regulator [Helicobacter trogontum]MCI5787281.1 MerR family transcriptional regulator [Helicobacter trogontum]
MADTIIEVERKTGISSHTLRFWVKKGLFPFIDRDKNGVKYFSEKDIKWVE